MLRRHSASMAHRFLRHAVQGIGAWRNRWLEPNGAFRFPSVTRKTETVFAPTAAATCRGPVSGAMRQPHFRYTAASSPRVSFGSSSTPLPAWLRISSASRRSSSFPHDRKAPIRGKRFRKPPRASAQKTGSIRLVRHVVPACTTTRGAASGKISPRTSAACRICASVITNSDRRSDRSNSPPKGALTIRRSFWLMCRSSGRSATLRFVKRRVGTSRAPSRSNPDRRGAAERRGTTPLLAFPWRSKATSYFPSRRPRTAAAASRRAAAPLRHQAAPGVNHHVRRDSQHALVPPVALPPHAWGAVHVHADDLRRAGPRGSGAPVRRPKDRHERGPKRRRDVHRPREGG